MTYGDSIEVFSDDPMPFYDADISSIIRGPGYVIGTEDVMWEGYTHTFSVAVALEEIDQSEQRTISYRFLGDNQQNYITSAILQVEDSNNEIIQGEINFARVAASSFEDYDHPDDPDCTFVEVAIVYQIEIDGHRDIQNGDFATP